MMNTMRRISTVVYNKMQIPREKTLAPSSHGVYPRSRELPSPVCCLRIMHIRTGTMWIAYCEMLWITSQVSFWAAQAVTGVWSSTAIMLGFVSVIVQIVFLMTLIRGIQHFRLSLLRFYMCALLIRTLCFVIMLMVILSLKLTEEEDTSSNGRLRLTWLKIIFLFLWIGLKMFALLTVQRCYVYIKKTKDFFRGSQSKCSVMETKVMMSGSLCPSEGCSITIPSPSSKGAGTSPQVKKETSKPQPSPPTFHPNPLPIYGCIENGDRIKTPL